MNPDVPSLEACRRLAKVWPDTDDAQERAWWLVDGASGDSDLCEGYTRRSWTLEALDELYPAPTIGEMLAEIRRRGWQVSLSTVGYGSAEDRFKATLSTVWQMDKGDCARRRIILGHVCADEPAEALANALAEALEGERK